MTVRACSLPDGALLRAYAAKGQTYTDCFERVVPGDIALRDFVSAFYTTWLFRLERLVLQVSLRRRITDAEVMALAGGADRFAAWTVEGRETAQILLRDLSGHTRSWLAVASVSGGATRLLFGSAVVAREGRPPGRFMRALIPLHRLYSRALLALAARRLESREGSTRAG